MSGIYGYALTDRHSESLLPIMRQGLAETAVTYEQWVSATKNVGLASEKPAQLKNATQTMQYSQQDVICFVDGVVYPDKSSTAPELADPHPAKTLLQQYLNSGIDCLRRINGSFVVAWWHQQEKKLIIATDKIGYRQLYYTHQPTGLFFSTYLARLPAMLTGTPEINEAAFAELLAYRNILGEQTLIKNINLLPTGSALIYEAGRANCYKYWRHDEIVPYGRYDNNRLDELADIFKLAVKRSFQPNRNSLLALTGGIDSRAILAASANQNLSYSTLTDGSPYGSDAMLARSAAHHVNVPHFSQPVYPHVLGDLLFSMVAYQSGIVSTIHSHPCHYLQSPLPFDNVISGILGGPVRSHWMKPKDLEHPTAQHAMRVILKAVASPTAKKIDVAPLWQSQYAELAKHGPQQHLNEIISEYAYPDTPLIATDYINFDEHARKFLNKGSAIALAHMDISIPYIDHEWVEAMRSVPLADRVNYNIQIDLIKRLSPSLLKIPYQKTMLPLTAGKFRVKVHKKMRLYRRGIRKKLSRKPHKTQPPAYDYAGWSRVEMRQAIENLICHPNAVYRSYLREDKVAPLLARHFAGKEDWEHLISALVVLEVVHRLWIDPQSNDN